MKTTVDGKKRASLPELLEFANAVREAGGGNPLDALMPAVPEDAHQCLIARNLNFNCQVRGADGVLFKNGNVVNQDNDTWIMYIEDEKIVRAVAKKLNLKKVYHEGWNSKKQEWEPDTSRPVGVLLPRRIGRIAYEFDNALDSIDYDGFDHEGCEKWTWEGTKAELRRLKDFWPYIEASEKEAYENADFVNEDGSIVI